MFSHSKQVEVQPEVVTCCQREGPYHQLLLELILELLFLQSVSFVIFLHHELHQGQKFIVLWSAEIKVNFLKVVITPVVGFIRIWIGIVGRIRLIFSPYTCVVIGSYHWRSHPCHHHGHQRWCWFQLFSWPDFIIGGVVFVTTIHGSWCCFWYQLLFWPKSVKVSTCVSCYLAVQVGDVKLRPPTHIPLSFVSFLCCYSKIYFSVFALSPFCCL